MKLSELKELAEKADFLIGYKIKSPKNKLPIKSYPVDEIGSQTILALLADREQLREALQYYADYKKWGAREMFGAFRGIPLEDCDQVAGGLTGGKTARAALKRSEELEK